RRRSWSGSRSGSGRVASRGPPFRALGVLCTPFAAGALLLRVVGLGWLALVLLEPPPQGRRGAFGASWARRSLRVRCLYGWCVCEVVRCVSLSFDLVSAFVRFTT